MSKLNRKLLVLSLITALMAGLLSGCGRKEETIDPNAIAFLANYQDIEFGSGYIQSAAASGDYLYAYTQEWIEAEMASVNKLLKASIADGTFTEIPLLFLGENTYINGMAINEQGNLILLAPEWNDEGAIYILYEVTPDGQKLSETDIGDKLSLGVNNWLNNMYSDGKGNLYFTISTDTGGSRIIGILNDGSVTKAVDYTNYIQGLLCTEDDVFASTWSETSTGTVLKKADFAAGSLGADIQFSGVSQYGNMSFAAGSETGLLISDGTSLYRGDMETMTATKLLNFIDSDIDVNDVRYFGQLENGSFWLLNHIWGQDRSITELIVLEQTTQGNLPARQNITYGTLYLGQDVRSAIINFNRSNQDYRIVAKEYINLNEDTDWQAAMIQFNNDLASGIGLDIIDLSTANFSMLAAKNALLDLNPLFEKSEINLDDYMENAIKAYELDGKKYGMMTGFAVNTLVGHESRLTGIDSWNVQDMIAWAEKYPDSQLMNTNSSQIMYTMVYSVLDKFVDWNTGTCDFTGEEFIKIMEFAATFGNDYDDWSNPNRIGTHEGLTTGKYLLMDQWVNNLTSLQMIDALFDGEAKFIGYPTETGSGFMLSPYGAVGISAKSNYTDGAFEFIKYMMSDAFQIDADNGRYTIPIKKSALDEVIRVATAPVSESQNYVSTWGYDDLMIEILQSRNIDFKDQFLDLISRADGLRFYDEQMYNIINEETESFFAGAKTAMEVAQIIQNRIQVYVNENR
ncbi:MAG: extracellular solute-binding protein [Lachnospiraceae bacterium]|nr:extracellular solute-binding protein [Lachnospiraceae bacterium]